MISESSVLDYIDIYAKAIKGKKDDLADDHRGSNYEVLGGVSAVIWSRETQRDTDLFNSTQFETCTDDELTQYAQVKFPEIPRILDAYGSGIATIVRPTTFGGSGTVWACTYILLFSDAFSDARFYVVLEDVVVSTETTQVELPIRAAVLGTGSRADAGPGEAAFEDPLWDNTWQVVRLICDEGTVFEEAAQYRARIRQTRKDNRVGYNTAIIKALATIGASNAVIFQSNYAGDSFDFDGITHVYVADAGFSTTTALLNTSKLLLESYRVLGDNSQVLGMQPVLTGVSMDVYLTDNPAQFDLQALDRIIVDALSQYFGGSTGGYTFKLDGMAGAIYRAIGDVREVDFTLPSQDNSVISIVNGVYSFPAKLNRYFLDTNNIVINYHPPR